MNELAGARARRAQETRVEMSEAGIPETASTAPPGARSFFERLLGVMRLDAAAYDDIAGDRNALGQAVIVVAASALAGGMSTGAGIFTTQGVVFMTQLVLLWPVFTLLVYVIGRWFGHTPDFWQIARLMGFARAPYLLASIAVVPVEWVRLSVLFVMTALLLATFVVGVRHALQTTIGRAVFVCVVSLLILGFGWMLYLALAAR